MSGRLPERAKHPSTLSRLIVQMSSRTTAKLTEIHSWPVHSEVKKYRVKDGGNKSESQDIFLHDEARTGNYLHPLLGVVHPLLMLTHTPKLCSPIGCVCTVVVYWCIRTQRRILCISLLGYPDILSVLVCLASVCIIYTYPKTVFYYAPLLPRRGPHIASHSVCPSVCLSVRPVIVTERHVAPPSELQ